MKRMRRHIDGNLNYTVNVNTFVVRFNFLLYTALMFLMGLFTLFYDKGRLPGKEVLGMMMMIAALFGVLLSSYVIRSTRMVGIIYSTVLLGRAAAFGVRPLFSEEFIPWSVTLNAVCVWLAMWIAFYTHWVWIIEPYATYRFELYDINRKMYMEHLEHKEK